MFHLVRHQPHTFCHYLSRSFKNPIAQIKTDGTIVEDVQSSICIYMYTRNKYLLPLSMPIVQQRGKLTDSPTTLVTVEAIDAYKSKNEAGTACINSVEPMCMCLQSFLIYHNSPVCTPMCIGR